MQEARRAHLIECDIKEIPFLRVLISYIKEMKLSVRIWGGHTHITEIVDWDSPKGDVSRFVRMSQDHTNYNMSLVSVQVKGITDLKVSAEVTCPESGNVIGKLLYLEKSTSPDISCAVHQCARHCANPKIQHTAAVKRIGRYLLGTKDKGLIMRPNQEGMECWVDAAHASEWNNKMASNDPGKLDLEQFACDDCI